MPSAGATAIEPLPELRHGAVALAPLAAPHREPLRAACAADTEIWETYSHSLLGPAFDRWWQTPTSWARWAVLHAGEVVGTTGLHRREAASLEIGGTYHHPAHRGTGLNRIAKWLVLTHVFAIGSTRAEFRVDARNSRSQAAVRKLGATHEGRLRRDKTTWTGHVRDTMVFSITDLDWPSLEPRLRPPA